MKDQSSSPQPETPQGFTPKEAAHQLDMTGKALRRAIRKGKIEATKVSGRWYLTPKAIASFKVSREAKVEEAKSEG